MAALFANTTTPASCNLILWKIFGYQRKHKVEIPRASELHVRVEGSTLETRKKHQNIKLHPELFRENRLL